MSTVRCKTLQQVVEIKNSEKVLLDPDYFYLQNKICPFPKQGMYFDNLFSETKLSVPDAGYSRYATCSLNLISTCLIFFLTIFFNPDFTINKDKSLLYQYKGRET